MLRPRAIQVRPLEDYRLFLKFDNGESRIFDAKPLLHGDWFGRLRDNRAFQTVHIAGLSVEWEDG